VPISCSNRLLKRLSLDVRDLATTPKKMFVGLKVQTCTRGSWWASGRGNRCAREQGDHE